MRYVRSFDLAALEPGATGPLLIRPDEGVGVSMRLHRGGTGDHRSSDSPNERFALVLSGQVALVAGSGAEPASAGSVIFIPAGAGTSLNGSDSAYWLEIESSAPVEKEVPPTRARVIKVDESRFEGSGFAYQSLADRSTGCRSLRLNMLQVQPGAGSPDFHIHAFAQLYVILDGEMTIDIGRARMRAPRHSIVCLPPGVVHRNFNASDAVERHISLLVPEPEKGEIFDYAVEIREHEAQMLASVPR